jgi:hypothetical protein
MRLHPSLLATLVAVFLAAPAALAQQDTNRPAGVPADIRQVEHASTLDAVELARRLADYGQREQSAHALLAAAQILIDNPIGADDDRFTGTAQEPDDTKPRGAVEDFSAQALISAARGMTTDRSLVALADEMAPRAREAATARARGLSGGAISIYRTVNAHQSLTLNGTFDGGRPARVSIIGDGDTDLDLYIYDENGYLITSGTGWTDRETVAWTPRWTGDFRIVIRNLGPVWNRFLLSTN